MLGNRQMDDGRVPGLSKVDRAVGLLMGGHMCSESVVIAYAEEFGLERQLAKRISGGFAGGMAQGKTCGAVSGAIMVLGLKYGTGETGNQYATDRWFHVVQEFSHRFAARRKSLECHEILMLNNVNPDNPGELKQLRAKGLCGKIVQDSVEILENLMAEDL